MLTTIRQETFTFSGIVERCVSSPESTMPHKISSCPASLCGGGRVLQYVLSVRTYLGDV